MDQATWEDRLVDLVKMPFRAVDGRLRRHYTGGDRVSRDRANLQDLADALSETVAECSHSSRLLSGATPHLAAAERADLQGLVDSFHREAMTHYGGGGYNVPALRDRFDVAMIRVRELLTALP